MQLMARPGHAGDRAVPRRRRRRISGRRGPGLRTLAGLVAGALVAGVGAGSARGDGEVTMRGAYYLETSTRVVQPMLDARFAIDEDTEVEVHTLVDVITSASPAAGAADTAFTERRYEVGAGGRRQMGDYGCSLFGRYSSESDYKSLFGLIRCQAELAQKNTTLATSLGGGRDDVNNAGAQSPMSELIEGSITSVLWSTSVQQLLSPYAIAGITYDLAYLQGFLANPYRRIEVGGGTGTTVAERVPDARARHAVFASVRGFVPQTRSVISAGYRLYLDNWGLFGHTPEMRWIQEITADVNLHARYRFHWQSAAEFYKPIYDTGDPALEPYITSDIKLSAFTTHTLGLKLELALSSLSALSEVLGGTRLEVMFEYVVQRNRFGNAVVAQSAVVVPFEY